MQYHWAMSGSYDDKGNSGCYRQWTTTMRWVACDEWQKEVENEITQELLEKVDNSI